MALEDELAKLTRRRGGPGKPRGERGVGFAVASIGVALLLVIIALVALSSFARTGPNEVGVVYNGGPLDKKTQRQLIPPSSGLTWTGWLSQDPRLYPSEGSPRRYIITSAPSGGDRVGVDNVRVPTEDGVDVGLEAKISFTTAFTGTGDDKLMKDFDARFGNRTYPIPAGGTRLHPCELISSCALLQQQNINALGKGSGDKTNANLIQVQQAIAKALTDDLSGNLGGNYFKSVQVIVSAVRLPDEVQKSVDEAQARFADVNQSRADLQRAKIRKQVNATLGASYRACPACAQIDALKSIPANVTAISLGDGGSIALSGSKK
jgi:regulator of protease activity HflC (stomatin/prohibitin superfamily)